MFPALTLNYLGQGALIVENPAAIESPFFLVFPEWSRIPMVVLATAATVIASQAVISGAFSVTRQAVGLGFLPRLMVRHTSEREIGQVYVPAINWGIFVAVVALVVGFGTSTALASAYGIAVTGTLAIDTILFFFVVRVLWKKPLWLVLAGGSAVPHRRSRVLRRQPHEGAARRAGSRSRSRSSCSSSSRRGRRAARWSRATAPKRRDHCGPSSTNSATSIHRSTDRPERPCS